MNYLRHFHGAFTETGIACDGCVYLHNIQGSDSAKVLNSTSAFDTAPREFPVFCASDESRLAQFVKDRVGYGRVDCAPDLILRARVASSARLLDMVDRAVQGTHEWQLLDEQLLAFNQIVSVVEEAKSKKSTRPHLMIIRGGPGTGKSVLALQLLAYGARHHWRVAHATGSKAFQTVLQAKTQHFAVEFLKRVHNVRYRSDVPVKEIFTTFRDIARLGISGRQLDVVIGDEGHRLWDFRRNVRTYRPESDVPMIEEMVAAAPVTIIFLDDHQGVRANEIGSASYLQQHSARLGLESTLIDLNIQFRCAGSTSYLNWVDSCLSYTSTISTAWISDNAYEFSVYNSIGQMEEDLLELSAKGDRCRMVAGFCWRWSEPRADGSLVPDVSDPRFANWAAPWIQKGDRYAEPTLHRYFRWASDDSCFSQIGSVYSVQGFEFDYVGVIFGDDLVMRAGHWTANLKRNKDRQFQDDLRRRQKLGEDVDAAAQLRNIYRVLMTRGTKGTFVYFLDEETRNHFQAGLRQ